MNGKVTRIKRFNLLLLSALLLEPVAVHAYRPLVTEDGAVMEANHFELEIANDYLENSDENHSVEGTFVPKVGLFGRTELNLTIPVIYSLR